MSPSERFLCPTCSPACCRSNRVLLVVRRMTGRARKTLEHLDILELIEFSRSLASSPRSTGSSAPDRGGCAELGSFSPQRVFAGARSSRCRAAAARGCGFNRHLERAPESPAQARGGTGVGSVSACRSTAPHPAGDRPRGNRHGGAAASRTGERSTLAISMFARSRRGGFVSSPAGHSLANTPDDALCKTCSGCRRSTAHGGHISVRGFDVSIAGGGGRPGRGVLRH